MMFLIEYENGLFIDGSKIIYLDLSGGKIKFSCLSEPEPIVITVDQDYVGTFINHLEAMNDNPVSNVQRKYWEIADAKLALEKEEYELFASELDKATIKGER